jgi:AcrR family transcriptional regulator
MSTQTAEKTSARERLLAAADDLFYSEGVHTVGIDRIIEHAGVAKATLYSTFGSKEELIRAYLERKHDQRIARTEAGLARFDTPREKMIGVFDVMGETFARPTYRGCAFMNASAESLPGGAVEEVSDVSRAATKAMFVRLAKAAGAKYPKALGAQLALVYDGAVITARMDRNPKAAAVAKTIATALVDAAIPA